MNLRLEKQKLRRSEIERFAPSQRGIHYKDRDLGKRNLTPVFFQLLSPFAALFEILESFTALYSGWSCNMNQKQKQSFLSI